MATPSEGLAINFEFSMKKMIQEEITQEKKGKNKYEFIKYLATIINKVFVICLSHRPPPSPSI